MAWMSLLFTLLAHCTGAFSQAVVTQETSLTTSPGGTVTLTCGSSTGAVTTSNYASWVQEKPYQVHKGVISSTSNRVPGIPARFSGSLIGDKAALTITGAQPEDEAEYYCTLWYAAVIQESSLTTSLGETVTLTCGSTTGPDIGKNFAWWIQEKPYQVHKCLIAQTSNRVHGVPARFTGFLLGDKAALTITGVQLEDEAEYYCAMWFSTYIHNGSLSQPVLTQPPSASSSLGKLVTLTCSLNSGYMKNNVDWYQQSFKKTVQFLMRVGQNGNVISKGDSIPDRFSGSGSGLLRYLNIQNVQDEDENIYYCGSDHGSGSNYV
ncbi:immunoglobulin kappa light chain-like [Acomys russatus]|uniref:immunoglobulin kappa light chain-like n=1 Tax=Acomys russatus TaxID=60746 RepID=UPI0021E27913|nr:immunoglobulin kappa light chain-like [Acomys russatus]